MALPSITSIAAIGKFQNRSASSFGDDVRVDQPGKLGQSFAILFGK